MPAGKHNAVRTIASLAIAACAHIAAAQSPFNDAWVDYTLNPDAHPNIPNVSHAGFRGGGVPLPAADGLTTVSVASFGATPNDATDDTVAVRIAISVAQNQSAANPDGIVVYFPPGEYILSGPLLVHTDNIHLRGAGEGQTTLRFTQSLTTSFANYPGSTAGDSNWSFNGGLIWFTDPNRLDYFTGVPTITTTNTGFRFVNTINITQPALLGDRTITVASAAALSPGETIVIEIENDDDLSTLRHLLGDGTWANNYNFSAANDDKILPDNRSSFRVYHTIDAINGNQVTLREPLRFDLRTPWDPEIKTLQWTRHNVGVADMTIHLDRDYEWTRADHNREPGFNGVAFTDTIDAFVHNVTIVNPGGLGVFINYCKNITVANVTLASTGPDRIKHHHGFGLANSADCLYTDFTINTWPLHGIYVGNFALHNVYSRGTLAHGTFDYHKLMPLANVYTEINIINDGQSGGGSTSGPNSGARATHWNINTHRRGARRVAQPDMMPRGTLVGVRCTIPTQATGTGNADPEVLIENASLGATPPNPPNLYEAQLALRLGQPIPNQPAAPECLGCNDDTVYAFDTATTGAGLVGQDGWIYERDYAEIDGLNVTVQTDDTHPDGTTTFALSTNGRDSIISRPNDAAYAYVPHRHDDTTAVMRFDARLGLPTGSGSGHAYLILNNPHDEGLQFGMSNSQFQIRGGRFSSVLQETVSIPSGWYTRGDWARLELRVDFTGNNGEGVASLFFKNLTDDDPDYLPVPGLQNVPLEGETAYPEAWDLVEFRIRNDAAVTNITPNADAADTPCCDADLDRDGSLTTDDVRTFLVLAAVDHPAADLDADGTATFLDVIQYLKQFDEGCP